MADYSVPYFSELMTSDDQARNREARKIADEILSWAKHADQPTSRALLDAHLGTVLRLADQCPFPDIREQFAQLLTQLPVRIPRRIYSGLSTFMPNFAPAAMDEIEGHEREFELYREMFFHDGRCSHMVQLMMCFPEYLENFVRTLHFVMRCDGPLPLVWRSYIGIMAVSRYNCKYLMHLLTTQFLVYGGNPKWLEGIRHAPPRLQNLQELNCILAHQPWLMEPSNIKGLVRGADSMSMSELAQVAVILTTYHSLCGFVFGCGVAPELDSEDGHTYSQDDAAGSRQHDTAPAAIGFERRWTDRTAMALKSLTEAEENDEGEDETPAQRLLSFARAEAPSEALSTGAWHESDLSARFTVRPKGATWPLHSVDFDTKDRPPFRIQDYSWQDHAYSQLNRFYSVAQLLDDEFAVAFSMTDNQLGESKELDTTKFRQAVWNYIHRLHGIFHDDYDYQEVNKLLDIGFKTYIKKVTCLPSLVTLGDFQTFGAGLRDAEKIHINILVMEARKQAQLIMFLHAVMRHMNS